ncbi:MAG TPA: glycosyltransferase, partial [Chloroflexota bacterium]|nr:glycosyltransferase [Chloroflexota bacterium]
LTVGVIVGILLLLGGIAIVRGPERHQVADALGVGLKNQIIALYSTAIASPTNTDDLAPIAETNLPPYAVNVFLDQEVQTANIERSLDLIKAAGFYFIKQELLWSDVERPAKGEYQDRLSPDKSSWANYDRIVNLAQQKGIQVIFRIDTTPTWARPPGVSKIETPPVNDQDFGDFVAAVVQRYKGRVHYYQIWNEPNLAFEWGNRVAPPAEYVHLLQIAYVRAKEVDPSVVILSAALAPTVENSNRAMPDVTFLQGMYAAGAKPYFDVLSTNAYGLRDGPDDLRINQPNDVNFSRPILLRQIMVRNGDFAKPIWASEIGWNSLPDNWPEVPLYGSVSRAIQAAYTVRAYQRAAEQWPWMGPMAVWHFRMVYPESEKLQQYYFDLVGVNWNIEPIYYALQKYMTAPPVVYRGFHQENHWALHWSAHWNEVADQRASLGGLKESQVAGATLSFDLDASWLDLVTTVGPKWGKLAVTIDGSPLKANDLPIENGQAILDLRRSQEQWQEHLAIADGLAPGPHHVVIHVLDGPVEIDGIVADRASPQAQLYWELTGGLIGLGALVIAVKRRPKSAIVGRDYILPSVSQLPSDELRPAKISAIVTVRNEEATIDALVQSLLQQTRAPDEIVIADGGSTDRTVEIVERSICLGAPIQLLHCPGANIAAGRNRAILAATGEIICCTDAGTRLAPNWLEQICTPFETGADVAMGFFEADPRSTFEWALGATTLPDQEEIDPDRFVPSSRSIAFRRSIWQAVGGYPEWLDYCEDVVFDLALRRTGCRFAWVPDAKVAYRPRTSLQKYFRQYYLYARGDGKANLWPRRHAIRYLTYLVAPLVFVLGFWYNRAWLGLLVAAGLYCSRPYRRLARSGKDRSLCQKAIGWLLVPGLRMVGDVAKMVGYPVGVWWRLQRKKI